MYKIISKMTEIQFFSLPESSYTYVHILYQFVSFMWVAYLMYSICKSQIHKWFEVKKKYSMKS